MRDIDAVLGIAPVIPVLIIEDAAHARPIAEALVGGGLRALEVTLRTGCAFEAIAEMRRVPGAVVGAGSVLDEARLDRAISSGAEFIVSPGLTDRLARAAGERRIAFLPGISTASDIMRGLDHGLSSFKFFPAEASGGLPALKALAGPFGQARFCPTGGVTPLNAKQYLAEKFVICVGGTWLCPPAAVMSRDWTKIAELAQTAGRR